MKKRIISKKAIGLTAACVLSASMLLSACGGQAESQPKTTEAQTTQSTDASASSLKQTTAATTAPQTTSASVFHINSVATAEEFSEKYFESEGCRFTFEKCILDYDSEAKSFYLYFEEGADKNIGIPVQSDELNLQQYQNQTVTGEGVVKHNQTSDTETYIYSDITAITKAEKTNTEEISILPAKSYQLTDVASATAFSDEYTERVGSTFTFENAVLQYDNEAKSFYLIFGNGEDNNIGIPVEADGLDLNPYNGLSVSGNGEVKERQEGENTTFYYANITTIRS